MSLREQTLVDGGFCDFTYENCYAGGGARTHTLLRVLDFESSASASSATPAAERIVSHSQHSAQEEIARAASPVAGQDETRLLK